MRCVVDPWDPSYGTAADDAAADSDAHVDLEVERALAQWAPVPAVADLPLPNAVVFVDGVRRVDARVWIQDDRDGAEADGDAGLCASWAAGAVVCNGSATMEEPEVGHGLFSASRSATDLVTRHAIYHRQAAGTGAPEDLSLALQRCMGESEVRVAAAARASAGDALLVVDGPLRGRQHLPLTMGLVKTHHTHYLPPERRAVLRALAPGERTPVFRIAGSWIRHSWYLRLPGPPGGPMAGIVRGECAAELTPDHAVRVASWSASLLPRFASEAHKDARAPQNLYPIGGLERLLRRRLGDPQLLYRALRAATA